MLHTGAYFRVLTAVALGLVHHERVSAGRAWRLSWKICLGGSPEIPCEEVSCIRFAGWLLKLMVNMIAG